MLELLGGGLIGAVAGACGGWVYGIFAAPMDLNALEHFAISMTVGATLGFVAGMTVVAL